MCSLFSFSICLTTIQVHFFLFPMGIYSYQAKYAKHFLFCNGKVPSKLSPYKTDQEATLNAGSSVRWNKKGLEISWWNILKVFSVQKLISKGFLGSNFIVAQGQIKNCSTVSNYPISNKSHTKKHRLAFTIPAACNYRDITFW